MVLSPFRFRHSGSAFYPNPIFEPKVVTISARNTMREFANFVRLYLPQNKKKNYKVYMAFYLELKSLLTELNIVYCSRLRITHDLSSTFEPPIEFQVLFTDTSNFPRVKCNSNNRQLGKTFQYLLFELGRIN